MPEFSTEVTKPFLNIADKQLACAASEILLKIADFSEASAADVSKDFPPEPSYLKAMQLAYIEQQSQGLVVRSRFLSLSDNPTVLQTFADSYGAALEPYQISLQGPNGEKVNDDNEFSAVAPNLSLREGLRTVAAFALFESASQINTFYSGLLIPKRTIRHAPLEFREIFVSIISRIGGKENLQQAFNANHTDEEPSPIDQIVGLHNSIKDAGVILAAMHLPDYGTVSKEIMLQQALLPPPAPKLNRAQRRAKNKFI